MSERSLVSAGAIETAPLVITRIMPAASRARRRDAASRGSAGLITGRARTSAALTLCAAVIIVGPAMKTRPAPPLPPDAPCYLLFSNRQKESVPGALVCVFFSPVLVSSLLLFSLYGGLGRALITHTHNAIRPGHVERRPASASRFFFLLSPGLPLHFALTSCDVAQYARGADVLPRAMTLP